MLHKESKIRVLENFYALDNVFFGKSVQKMKACCEALTEDYMTVKGAFMSLMIEMYGIIDHTPNSFSEKIRSARAMRRGDRPAHRKSPESGRRADPSSTPDRHRLE